MCAALLPPLACHPLRVHLINGSTTSTSFCDTCLPRLANLAAQRQVAPTRARAARCRLARFHSHRTARPHGRVHLNLTVVPLDDKAWSTLYWISVAERHPIPPERPTSRSPPHPIPSTTRRPVPHPHTSPPPDPPNTPTRRHPHGPYPRQTEKNTARSRLLALGRIATGYVLIFLEGEALALANSRFRELS